jgi:demethylmenaquinone methyltransferase/2-methoxy-6-polyprenyl-1,4-benzoquinol methylase
MKTGTNDHREYTQNFFDQWVRMYDLFVLPLRPLRRKIAGMIAGEGNKILDVACGTGEQSIAIAKAGADVFGIDIATGMLSVARRKIRPEYKLVFEELDASHLPFHDDSFDASTVSLALHDMPKDMAVAILWEMCRVTKSGGVIAITDYRRPTTWIATTYHLIMRHFETRYYPSFMKDGLDPLLKEANLTPSFREPALLGILEIVLCNIL